MELIISYNIVIFYFIVRICLISTFFLPSIIYRLCFQIKWEQYIFSLVQLYLMRMISSTFNRKHPSKFNSFKLIVFIIIYLFRLKAQYNKLYTKAKGKIIIGKLSIHVIFVCTWVYRYLDIHYLTLVTEEKSVSLNVCIYKQLRIVYIN